MRAGSGAGPFPTAKQATPSASSSAAARSRRPSCPRFPPTLTTEEALERDAEATFGEDALARVDDGEAAKHFEDRFSSISVKAARLPGDCHEQGIGHEERLARLRAAGAPAPELALHERLPCYGLTYPFRATEYPIHAGDTSPPAFGEPAMTATVFDTLSTARDLEAAGFERRQAEALAGAVRQASAADREALATKGDLAEIRADLAEHRAATKGDLAEIRADLAEHRTATKGDLAEIRADLANFATKGDLAEIRADLANFATKGDLAGVRDELRDEIHRKTETLRSEMRWMLAFQGALILAIAARLFGIV